MRKTFYLCNGKDPDCLKTACYLSGMGGECCHTDKEAYALNKAEDRQFIGTPASDLWEVPNDQSNL